MLRQGRLEASVLLINTPECLISEGLADLGHRVRGRARRGCRRCSPSWRDGLVSRLPANPPRNGPAWALNLRPRSPTLRRSLGAVGVNAALMRHVDGASHEDVAAVPRRRRAHDARSAPRSGSRSSSTRCGGRTSSCTPRASELLREWLARTPADDARARAFARLLHEQLTPGQAWSRRSGRSARCQPTAP